MESKAKKLTEVSRRRKKLGVEVNLTDVSSAIDQKLLIFCHLSIIFPRNYELNRYFYTMENNSSQNTQNTFNGGSVIVARNQEDTSVSSISNNSNGNYFTTRGMNMYNVPAMPPLVGNNQVSVSGSSEGGNNTNVVRGEEEIVVGDGGGRIEIGDTTAKDTKHMREMNLIKAYADGIGMPRDKDFERSLKKNFRAVLLPKVKFIQTGKNFGSFEQQNLTEKDCIANELFNMLPDIAQASDRTKAKYWITYRGKLKEMVSSHKAKATLAMKKKVIDGE